MYEEELIEVNPGHILLAAVPLICIAVISNLLGLNLETSILIGSTRTFIQLSILSLILDPIFSWGVELWWVVVGYAVFMIVLASFESASRCSYYFGGMFWYVLGTLLCNVTWVALFAFGIILVPSPIWDPHYVIPIIGMLLGNCINGISLSLNAMLVSIVDSAREIELLLAFGATPYEASSRLLRESIRTGTMPQLNSMAIIGLISIPGMMTGQILGGSSVTDAARYQILIMYFIATCSFGAVLSQLFLSLRICFDSSMVLRTDRLTKRRKKKTIAGLVELLCSSTRDCFCHAGGDSDFPEGITAKKEETTILPKGVLTVAPKSRGHGQKLLSIDELAYSFEKFSAEEKLSSRRTLFSNLSFQVEVGQTVLVEGPSGVGKSTLLRVLAGLTSTEEGRVRLNRQLLSTSGGRSNWRKQVLYIPQTRPDIPGSPCAFLQTVSSFRSWAQGDKPSFNEMKSSAEDYLRDLGMHTSMLDSEWKVLSGGESQRVLLAIALASKPRVLLLDESTSALDVDSKRRVEDLVRRQAQEFGLASVWITHDEDQKKRLISVSPLQ